MTLPAGAETSAATQWTVQGLLDWATQFFAKQGIESPHLEAEMLLAYALGCKRIELYLRYATVVDETGRARFKEAVVRRTRHEPVAYITGTRAFYSLEFKVTPDVLIPRPETETLVETALSILADLKETGPVLRLVDVGTGSGNIPVSLAKFLPALSVLGIDVSEKALVIASENAERLGVSERCLFRKGSLLEPLSDYPAFEKPDLITANLPYVTQRDYDALPAGIKQFEPASALLGGVDGLQYIIGLIPQAGAHLLSGRFLLLEIGAGQAALLQAMDFSQAGMRLIRFDRDLAGIQRVAVYQKV